LSANIPLPLGLMPRVQKQESSDRRFVEMIMKEQAKKLQKTPKVSKTVEEVPEPPGTPPPVHADGYIDYKVDFNASLSEKESNSWCDEISISANDPNNVDDDEDEDDYYGEGKPKVRFNKDDGDGLLIPKHIKKAAETASPRNAAAKETKIEQSGEKQA
jgi:hypothetical protein